jgi:hypothetical protein
MNVMIKVDEREVLNDFTPVEMLSPTWNGDKSLIVRFTKIDDKSCLLEMQGTMYAVSYGSKVTFEFKKVEIFKDNKEGA